MPLWHNGRVFIYEQSGYEFESCFSHLKKKYLPYAMEVDCHYRSHLF